MNADDLEAIMSMSEDIACLEVMQRIDGGLDRLALAHTACEMAIERTEAAIRRFVESLSPGA